MARQVADTTERTYDDLDEAIAAVTLAEPAWSAGDVHAKAEALTQVDEAAARADPPRQRRLGRRSAAPWPNRRPPTSTSGSIKGEQATGSYVPDGAVPTFAHALGPTAS